MQIQELEAIIQRFTSGERHGETAAFLFEAAWEAFHDPWEARPTFEAGQAPMSQPRLKVAEPEAQALPAMLTAFLEARQWVYWKDPGDLLCCFPALEGQAGRDLTLRLGAEGARRQRLKFRLTLDRRILAEAFPSAEALCDTWNGGNRLTHATLRTRGANLPATAGPVTGTLVLTFAREVPEDANQACLDSLVERLLAEAMILIGQARKAMGL